MADWKPVHVRKFESFFVKPEGAYSQVPAAGVSGPLHYIWLKGTISLSLFWIKYVCIVTNLFQRNNLESPEIARCWRNSFSCDVKLTLDPQPKSQSWNSCAKISYLVKCWNLPFCQVSSQDFPPPPLQGNNQVLPRNRLDCVAFSSGCI